jgi:acyl-CoA thioester hydrolase
LSKAPVRIRVIYADTDAMGIVYHTNYIRWFEIGRIELLRKMGITYSEVEKTGFYLPVTRVYCHYHLPAHYDEIVFVETRIAYLKRASMKFTYLIWDEIRENLLTEGYTIHACTDRDGKIIRIPSVIADKIGSECSMKKGKR